MDLDSSASSVNGDRRVVELTLKSIHCNTVVRGRGLRVDTHTRRLLARTTHLVGTLLRIRILQSSRICCTREKKRGFQTPLFAAPSCSRWKYRIGEWRMETGKKVPRTAPARCVCIDMPRTGLMSCYFVHLPSSPPRHSPIPSHSLRSQAPCNFQAVVINKK